MTTRYEYYNAGDDQAYNWVEGVTWIAQTFTVGASGHKINSVKLLLYKTSTPGTVTVGIRATSSSKPTGADLTSGTTNGNTLPTGSPYEWREITVTEYTLTASTMYAIVVRAAASGVGWRRDGSSPTYADGAMCYSGNSGVSWDAPYTDYDMMFEVWGAGAVIPTVTTQAASSLGLD